MLPLALLLLFNPPVALAAPGDAASFRDRSIQVDRPSRAAQRFGHLDDAPFAVRVIPIQYGASLLRQGGSELRIDFGQVGATGATPRTGTRYTLPNGDMVLVTTVELVVVERGRSEGRGGRGGVLPEGARAHGGRPIGLGFDDVRKMVFARVFADVGLGGSDHTGVVVAPAGTTDWSQPLPPLPPGPHLLALQVLPGERIAVDVGMYIAAAATGSPRAEVSFRAE